MAPRPDRSRIPFELDRRTTESIRRSQDVLSKVLDHDVEVQAQIATSRRLVQESLTVLNGSRQPPVGGSGSSSS